jgi:signal transduction histidine kinase
MENRSPALRYAAALAVMAFFGVILVEVTRRDPGRLGHSLVDAGLGVAGLALLHWRRRHPFTVASILAVSTVMSSLVVGPAFVAYVSLTTRGRRREIAACAVLHWTATTTGTLWLSGWSQVSLVTVVAVTFSLVTLTVTGLYLRSRRDLAEARARQELERLDQARLGERLRIAREMHDVLAHRLSLLTLHANALVHRTDLTPDEVRGAAAVIQESAHQSLEELRATLGVLRAGTTPQPSFDTLGALFDEVRTAGQQVTVTDRLQERETLPTQAGRHVYRVVQEGLTNARKHAPGAPVTVELDGRPGGRLRVTISNPAPEHPVAGDGLGLVGLAERMTMIGGTLDRVADRGRFVLAASLPWEARA